MYTRNILFIKKLLDHLEHLSIDNDVEREIINKSIAECKEYLRYNIN